jgi:hypothetical protein
MPSWALPCLVVVAVAFTLVRNTSSGSLAWLDSA